MTTITRIKVTDDKAALTRVWDANYAEQHAGKTYKAILTQNGHWATSATAKFEKENFEVVATGKVVISEVDGEDGLYEITFEGTAEDFGFSDESDYLTAEDVYDIAKEVADETNSAIEWIDQVPAWFCV